MPRTLFVVVLFGLIAACGSTTGYHMLNTVHPPAVTCDLNNDGRVDTIDLVPVAIEGEQRYEVYVTLGPAAGASRFRILVWTAPNVESTTTCADIDGDGKKDLSFHELVRTGYYPWTVKGKGDGTFETPNKGEKVSSG